MGAVSNAVLISGVSDATLAAATGLYGRTVDVHRTISISSETVPIGDVGYSGEEQTTTPAPDVEGEKILFTGLPCSISVVSAGRVKGPLPADVVYKPMWRILIPSTVISQYDIRDRDILIDDEGYRYGVGAAMWTPAGYQLECVRLEA